MPVFAVFNPKGGVGKTTIATNLAAVLQLRKEMNVLLLDADTVTGHVGLSLGLPNGRSMADSWIDEDAGYGHESMLDLAAVHSSGIRVVALSTNPLHQPTLLPARVADSIMEARHGVDAIVIDLHPSYSEVNLAIFAIADRILVPVTPDLPAMRAAIQLKDVAVEVGVRDRLAMIINRANSGVTVSDMETTVGLKAIAHIRSAGLHFVWSANAGKTLIDKFPRHPATARLRAACRPAPVGPRRDRRRAAEGDQLAPQEPVRAKGDLRSLIGSSARPSTTRSASGGSAWPAWIQPHGPRRTNTATMPAAWAGLTSLSSRSPTYAIAPGRSPSSDATRAKNAGSGFEMPQPSEVATSSNSMPSCRSTLAAGTGWLPAMPSR